MEDHADLSMKEKRKLIRKKLDEAINLVLQYDTNNVGMPWPGDIDRAKVLREIKEYYSE